MDNQEFNLEKEKYKAKVVKTVSTDVAIKPRWGSIKRQWAVGFLANITLLSAGMALGFPAISFSQLTSPESKTMLNQSQASWFASVNTITCPLGGLLASVILDKLGRKFVIILINVLSIVAWSIQSWTNEEDAQTMFYQLLAARLIIGECYLLSLTKRRLIISFLHRYRGGFIKFTSLRVRC